jgi:type IV secretion system protein VirB2
MRRQYSTLPLPATLFAVALAATPAHAAGSGMPWETPLQAVVDSSTGRWRRVPPWSRSRFGRGLAFSETGSRMWRGLSILFGLAIAFAAASFFLDWFGFARGMTLPVSPAAA